MPIVRVWADVASNHFLYESTESQSKTFRPRKFLIANPCHCHGHGHRSGSGPSSQANGFYRDPKNRHPKTSVPNFFDSQSMPPPWAWSSLGVWADLAADRFLYEPTESPSKMFRPRKFLIANPCRCHGHGHRSGLGRSWKRSVFKGINGIVVQNFSAPKSFDSQSMPPPWAWSSLGLWPISEAISF